MTSVSTEICTVSERADGIIEFRFVKKYEVDVDDIPKLQKAFNEVTNARPDQLLLVVPGEEGGITKEAREIDMYGPDRMSLKKLAIVTPRLHQKILGRLFFTFVRKPSYPYEFFGTEQNAVNWLKSSES